MKRRAFTLIELLVVIAIIAILAAILFPVFAQAKQAAKKATTQSNLKQLSLGIIMYSNDTDDVPANAIGNRSEWGNSARWCETWSLTTQPYVKTYDVYRSPLDGSKTLGPGHEWKGVAISFAANAAAGWDNGLKLFGVMGFNNRTPEHPGEGWEMPSQSLSGVAKPAETVLLGERHNDTAAASGGAMATVFSSQFFEVDWLNWLSGPASIPGAVEWDGKARPADTGKPGDFGKTQSGAVTPNSSGQATFAFTDGHVKSMKPVATNPDQWKKPELNMWYRDR